MKRSDLIREIETQVVFSFATADDMIGIKILRQALVNPSRVIAKSKTISRGTLSRY